MVHHSGCVLLLLLLLTCLAGFSASETEQSGSMVDTSYGPSSVEISGVDIVTVGVPYSFLCTANCYPGCQFSWTRGNVTSQGPELTLQLLHKEPPQTLTCMVVNPTTGKSITVQKKLQVTVGPSNIQISGPPMLTIGTATVFTCSADCYPSCTYSWNVVLQGEPYSTAQGSTISVTPAASTVDSETLVCEAEDTVSHLYISTTLKLWVTSVTDINIEGPSTVTMGKQYMFICWVACVPSCTVTWKYMGKIFQGKQIQLPIMHQGDKPKYKNYLKMTFSDYSKTEPLTCEATNDVSHVTINTTTNLTVFDPISVKPTSQAPPVVGKTFSLQCTGSQNPASITWFKNNESILPSERVHFSPDNIEMTFSPLLQTDDGLYKCVVAEGGIPIPSIPYKMQVFYGPSSVVIKGVDILTVGQRYDFQCSASCYPPCQFTWTWGNATSQGPQLSLQLGELRPTQDLTCTAVNPTTGMSVSATKTLQLTAGPSNIHISGPAFLTAGIASTFKCSADCYPSCSYNWTIVSGKETLSTAQGNTVLVTPARTAVSETLICQAQDTVSHHYISTSLMLWVASLSDVTITGNSTVAMEKRYTYTCSATCIPSCTFMWKYMGKILQGDEIQTPIVPGGNKPNYANQLEITISDYSKTEPLTCEVTNSISQATITSTKILSVIDPFSVQPTSHAPPVAGKSFSLECFGPQMPASITWLKNKQPIPASEKVHFSPDNTTISFSHLAPSDGGFYQCLVLEAEHHNYNTIAAGSGTPILSLGYLLQVNYGPDKVLIVKPKKESVGGEMVILPGSTTELQCLTDCFPTCSITWFYNHKLLSTNATILFTPTTPPYKAPLICMAFNSATNKRSTAETTVLVPDGPKNVMISGPDSLELGVTASFTCSAECTPPCNFKWTMFEKTSTGSKVNITVNRPISTESISCQAENKITKETMMVNKKLSVSDPHWCGC